MDNKTPITLDYYESSILNRLLNREYKVFDKNYCEFKREELENIRTITLTGVSSIRFLIYLTNLEELNIISNDYSLIQPESTYESAYFNIINNNELNLILKRLPNIKSLKICNDLNIHVLDLTNNKKLNYLSLENNPELTKIIGLDDLHELKKIKMYGNNLNNIGNLNAYIYNTLDAKANQIDISCLFTILNKLETIEQKIAYLNYLDELHSKGLINLVFSEKNGYKKYNSIYIPELIALVKNYLNLFKKRDLFNKTDEEKIEYVLKYIKNNIAFNKNGLIERQEFIKEFSNEQGIVPDWGNKYVSYLHNSYSTFKLKRGNCEGIVNLTRIMLMILNIESEDVQCSDRRTIETNSNNHALLRAKINDTWYYFDPAFDKTAPGYYEYMSYSDAIQYLRLNLYEMNKTLGVEKNENTQLHYRHRKKH